MLGFIEMVSLRSQNIIPLWRIKTFLIAKIIRCCLMGGSREKVILSICKNVQIQIYCILTRYVKLLKTEILPGVPENLKETVEAWTC